jgi:hypothetical protein
MVSIKWVIFPLPSFGTEFLRNGCNCLGTDKHFLNRGRGETEESFTGNGELYVVW